MLVICCACRSARFTAKTDTPRTKHLVLWKDFQAPKGWSSSFKGHLPHKTLVQANIWHTLWKLMIKVKCWPLYGLGIIFDWEKQRFPPKHSCKQIAGSIFLRTRSLEEAPGYQHPGPQPLGFFTADRWWLPSSLASSPSPRQDERGRQRVNL